jgi:hypothetical protein
MSNAVYRVSFEVLTVATVKITVYWTVKPCTYVFIYLQSI